MFERPGESPFDAFTRYTRENWHWMEAGQDWLNRQKPPYEPPLEAPTRQQEQQIEPSATIQILRPELDVEHQGVKGMDIHLTFSTVYAKNLTLTLLAQFYFANLVPVRHRDRNLYTSSTFKPGRISVWFEHAVLFMPYSELHLPPGSHSLRVVASIWDAKGRWLAWSHCGPFTLQV